MTYDLSKYPRHQPADKPYWMPEPATEEQTNELNLYLETEKQLEAALAEIPDEYLGENRASRLFRIVDIGQTLDGEHVCLIMQGMFAANKFCGGCYPVVCQEFGLSELQADLEDTEREFVPELEKIFEPDIKSGAAKYV